MYDQIIKLVAETRTTNSYGDAVVTTQDRTRFAELKSITQSEFWQAQSAGFKPEIKFVLADFLDYAEEPRLKYTPYGGTEEEYTILRTYRVGTTLELVCKRGVDT